jgi:serine/threonine protein kinase
MPIPQEKYFLLSTPHSLLMSTHSPHSPDAWLGQRLGNPERYRLDRRLGSGAVGDVFLAMDLRMGRRVAIKVLKGMFSRSPELLARFEREIALSAALNSEHIVQVMDYGVTSKGNPFYVMEYLQGHTLRQLLGSKNPLTIEETIAIAIQLCAGLQVAHAGATLWKNQAPLAEPVKVIHRDLKPANIFLIPTPLGKLAKILDFGIAKKLHASQQSEHTQLTQTFLGTFRYAAPEQLRTAWDLDERADIYSLGMILYEMLSGTDPFGITAQSSRPDQSWATAHTAVPPTPLRQQPHCADIPTELEAAVMHCLHKHPNERFTSVMELSQRLQTVQVNLSEPPTQVSSTAPQPTPPPDASEAPTIFRPIAQYAQVQVPEQDGTIFQPMNPVEIPPLNQNAIDQGQNTDSRNDQINHNLLETDANRSQPSHLHRLTISPHDATIAQTPPPLRPTSPTGDSSDTTLWQVPAHQPNDATVAQIAAAKRPGKPNRKSRLPADPHVRHRSEHGVLAQAKVWLQSSASNYVDRARAHASAEMRHKAYRLLTQFLPIGIGFAFGLASLSGAYFLLRSRGTNLSPRQPPFRQPPSILR